VTIKLMSNIGKQTAALFAFVDGTELSAYICSYCCSCSCGTESEGLIAFLKRAHI